MIPSLRSAGTACGRLSAACGPIPVMVLLLLAALVRAAEAQTPCVAGCDTCLDVPCTDFDECRSNARGDQYDLCVSGCDPPVKNFPSFEPGRCTLIRECVGKCRDRRSVVLGDCRRRLRRDIRDSCDPDQGKCGISSRRARKLCADCDLLTEAIPAPAAAVAPLARSCQAQCLERHVGDCYAMCAKECQGDQDAVRACRTGCNDSRCNLLRRKCTVPDDETASAVTDPRYVSCCGTDFVNCLDDDEESIACEATTTSTTVTSTTSTTSTTTRNTTTTTTLIGPVNR